MAIPVVVVLGVGFWILISIVKYWYTSRTKINCTHKLDDSVLEEIRKAPEGAFERVCHSIIARYVQLSFFSKTVRGGYTNKYN